MLASGILVATIALDSLLPGFTRLVEALERFDLLLSILPDRIICDHRGFAFPGRQNVRQNVIAIGTCLRSHRLACRAVAREPAEEGCPSSPCGLRRARFVSPRGCHA
jgi:hypothetical protein